MEFVPVSGLASTHISTRKLRVPPKVRVIPVTNVADVGVPPTGYVTSVNWLVLPPVCNDLAMITNARSLPDPASTLNVSGVVLDGACANT
ncbi:MAG: hypothetical protein D6706_16410 [Chloroflexi bacterium]|nr:MAG: hypothetical protein D6706_16410 [Chloroflexota bacterium]